MAQALDSQADPVVGRRPKPAMRGWLHEIAALSMLVIGPLIVLRSTTTAEYVCTSIACFSVTAMLATSALFHRVTWKTATARRRMRKGDHSAIFLCIAGSYTAVAGLSLPTNDAWIVLIFVWGGAIAGVVMRFVWMDAPKWAVALPYVAVGWVAVFALPELVHALGGVGFALLLGGGLLYTVGAVCYAMKRPDPWPTVFGYHEIFHACVVLAAACHLVLITYVILPAAS